MIAVTLTESVDLATYQLQGLSYTWYKQWNENRGANAKLVEWDKFVVAFLDSFFPLKLRESKLQEFINMKQGRMSVKDFSLKFT